MGYSALQATRLAGCSTAQLEYWQRIGLVAPGPDGGAEPYSFRDLVVLRTVRSLLDAGLSMPRVRRAVEVLLEAGDDLAELRVVTDGDSVWACHDDGQVLDALRNGQLALFVAVDRVVAGVEADVRAFARDRASFVQGLGAHDHPAGSG